VLALVAIAAVVAGVLALGGGSSKETRKPAAPAAAVRLAAAASLDPFSDDHTEHPERVPLATDRNPSTYWETSTYYSGLGKPGVGLVLDAGKDAAPSQVTIVSDTPGFTAQIRTASSPSGPLGPPDSASQTVSGTTAFPLRGRTARYFVVWITSLGANRQVHVNEVGSR
jgi:hypothetical protein